MDSEDLQNATDKHTKLSQQLDTLLGAEKDAEIALLQKETDIRKELFIQVEGGDMSVAHFKELLKDKTFTEMVEYKKSRTERRIKENQLRAIREILYSLKLQIKLI